MVGELPQEITVKKQTKEEIKAMHDFYTVTGSASGAKIKFDKLLLTERLRKLGFIRYDQPGGKFEYVRLQDGKIRIVSITQIKDAFEDYILSLPDYNYPYTYTGSDGNKCHSDTKVTGHRLQEILYNSIDTYFGSTMDRLRPTKPVEFMRDQAGIKYLYFRNCVVKVTRDGFEKMPYDQVDGYIWEANIIDRDFSEDYTTGDFEQFISNICNKKRERKESLMSMIGYLMHDFYDCNLRAVLLTDANMEEENATAAAGGTGKGLIGKALGQMLNRTRGDVRYCAVPGKGFDASDDKRYQLADISTQLIHIEDLDKRFSLSSLYNDITDGATFRKMYGDKSIHFAKFLLSVNHTIRLDASSDKRRVYIFELFNYYNEDHTPIDDFHKMFFSGDWTDKDWSQFYTFMIQCCQRYLQYGVEQAEQINYKRRRLLEVFATQSDLMYTYDKAVEDALKTQGKRLAKRELWEQFSRSYPGYLDSQRTFTEKLRTYLKLKEIDYREVRGNGGNDYFVLFPNIGTVQTQLDFYRTPSEIYDTPSDQEE